MDKNRLLRSLPKVDEVLRQPAVALVGSRDLMEENRKSVTILRNMARPSVNVDARKNSSPMTTRMQVRRTWKPWNTWKNSVLR